MLGTEKYTWGIVLNTIGGLLFVGGVALSFTLIGACIGIPMAIVGLPIAIWGVVWAFQGHSQKQQEAIAAGIREGIQYQALPPGEYQDLQKQPQRESTEHQY